MSSSMERTERTLPRLEQHSPPFLFPPKNKNPKASSKKFTPSQTMSGFADRLQSRFMVPELNETPKSKSRCRYKLLKSKEVSKEFEGLRTEPSPLISSFLAPEKTREGLAKFSLIYYPPAGPDPTRTFTSFSDLLSTHKTWTQSFNEPFNEPNLVSQQLYHNVRQKALIERTQQVSLDDAYFGVFGGATSLDWRRRVGSEKTRVYTNDKDKDMKALLAVKKLIENTEEELERDSISEPNLQKGKKKPNGIEQLENMSLHFKFYWYKINSFDWRPENREGASLTLLNGRCYLYGGKARKTHEGIVELDLKKWTWQRLEGFRNEQNFQARLGHTAIAYKRQLLVYGGEHLYNDHLKIRDCLGDLKLIDFDTREIRNVRTMGDFIENRRNHASCLFANKFLFISGGVNSNGRYLADLMNLNLETLKWSTCLTEPGVSDPVAFHTMLPVFRTMDKPIYDLYKAFDLDLKHKVNSFSKIKEEGVYVFGGKDGEGRIYNTLRVLKLGCYPFKWVEPETKGEVPAPRYLHSMSFFQDLNVLVIYGGRNDHSLEPVFSDVCVLNVFNLCWSKVSLYGLVQLPKCAHSAALFGSKLLVFGGYTLQEYVGSDLFIMELDQDLVKSYNDKNRFNVNEKDAKDLEESDSSQGKGIVPRTEGTFLMRTGKSRITYLPIPGNEGERAKRKSQLKF